MSFRDKWRERGALYDCPNPPHAFKIGRWVGEWRWASDCWSSVSETGVMSNYGLCLCTLNTLDGITAYKLVIWRLSVMFARTAA